MIITITGRQTEVPSDFAKTAEKKLNKFDKFFREDASATLKIGRKRGRETVELTILSGGTLFRSEKQDDTMLNAFDSTIEAIEGQIRKNKTRLSKRLKEGAFAKNEKVGDVAETEEQEFKIRTKTFKFKPMSTEEAILQMNLLGHNFFVFENDESGKVNVVYLRNDGDYGHIIPD